VLNGSSVVVGSVPIPGPPVSAGRLAAAANGL